ncbi:MAG TPA: Smr/MutS family protein [Candidatus Gracilibacteria bacterium]|nr:Smr/MutS family protein [Candidatus Gracilibacteria bacterium]
MNKPKHNKYSPLPPPCLDLHGLTQAEAKPLIIAFIQQETQNRSPKIRIITGQGLHSRLGKSVLKELCLNIIHQQKLQYSEANFNEGGSGALDIIL